MLFKCQINVIFGVFFSIQVLVLVTNPKHCGVVLFNLLLLSITVTVVHFTKTVIYEKSHAHANVSLFEGTYAARTVDRNH